MRPGRRFHGHRLAPDITYCVISAQSREGFEQRVTSDQPQREAFASTPLRTTGPCRPCISLWCAWHGVMKPPAVSKFLKMLQRRALQALPLLLLISLLVFLLIHAAPGGPLAIYLANPNVRPEDIERLRRALGLDRPLWLQYWSWLVAFVQGDWGFSFSDGRDWKSV